MNSTNAACDPCGPMPTATLVVPTYNASSFIERTVNRLRQFVHQHPDWCVLFICDGCSDDTDEKLAGLIERDAPALRMHSYASNRGKGYALRCGLSLAQTPFRFFTDVDLAYDPDEAVKLLGVLDRGGYDLAVVNRVDPRSRYLVSPCDFHSIYKRHLMSRAFNWFLRWMLPITILDTQAGLKGMTAAAWTKLSPRITTDGFFFDVELLARAGAAGLNTGQAPVYFSYIDPTTVRMVRHGGPMIMATLRLRRSLKRERRQQREFAQSLIRPAILAK